MPTAQRLRPAAGTGLALTICISLLLQAGLATDKAYARKLEAKLSASKSLSDLQLRCCEYKQRVRQLQGDVQEAEARVQSAQELADARSDEVLSACTQSCF